VKLVLDSNVLGKICHPRKHLEVRAWFVGAVREHEVLLPEVADYELRRELVRIGSTRSLARLDELTRELRYVPVATTMWRQAARLWAELRTRGLATASEERLDVDVLLAAVALAEQAWVVTSNVRHISLLVPAVDWSGVPSS
jgi:predicted nucleic acid-binding protein